MKPDLAKRLAAAEAVAARLPAPDAPALPWNILGVETRLALLDVLDRCATEDELDEALDERPELRAAIEAVLDAARS